MSVVVLPAPLAPIRRRSRPRRPSSDDVVQDVDRAVAGPQIVDVQQGGHQLTSSLPRYASITFGSRLDLGRRPLGDLHAVVEHRDAVGDAHHQAHVVLDQQHRDAAVADLADQLHQVDRLARVHPGGRLVEQQQLRLGGEGPGDLEPPLVAVGEVLGQLVRACPVRPTKSQQLDRLRLGVGLLARAAAAAAGPWRTGCAISCGPCRPARSPAPSCPGTGGCSGTCGRCRPARSRPACGGRDQTTRAAERRRSSEPPRQPGAVAIVRRACERSGRPISGRRSHASPRRLTACPAASDTAERRLAVGDVRRTSVDGVRRPAGRRGSRRPRRCDRRVESRPASANGLRTAAVQQLLDARPPAARTGRPASPASSDRADDTRGRERRRGSSAEQRRARRSARRCR